MGLIDRASNRLVYLDTNIFIYALSDIPELGTIAQDLLSAVERGDCRGCVSELALSECLVKPYELGEVAAAAAMERVFQSRAGFDVIAVSRPILKLAAELRASVGVKLPDAIHAATSIIASCELFVTNDRGFQRIDSLPVVLLSEHRV